MKKGFYKTSLLLLFLMTITSIRAQQKNIFISDDLAATSEKFKVKMGTQWMGKIWNFKFGDYAVVKSKLGWTVTSQKGNFIDTRTESKTENKFSFVLCNKDLDSAFVNAINNVTIKELRSFKLLSSDLYEIDLGSDELLTSTNLFTSFIITKSNKKDVWFLSLNRPEGNEENYTYEGFIRNNDRIIRIIPVSSNTQGTDSRTYHALGYEFIEYAQSLCAVQYYGGGAFGFNKNIIWIKSELEPRMKLILSAAMTSLLQLNN